MEQNSLALKRIAETKHLSYFHFDLQAAELAIEHFAFASTASRRSPQNTDTMLNDAGLHTRFDIDLGKRKALFVRWRRHFMTSPRYFGRTRFVDDAVETVF